MPNPDLLDAIRAALLPDPPALAQVEPVLEQMRQRYGGDTVYIRAPARLDLTVTRRTVQRRMRRHPVPAA